MDIQGLISEKIQRLQDLQRQMNEIGMKIGALQEEGRALHGASLEVKGGIDALATLKMKEDEALAKSQTAKLLLPEGVKPIVADEPKAETAATPTPAVTVEAPKADAPVLEVK